MIKEALNVDTAINNKNNPRNDHPLIPGVNLRSLIIHPNTPELLECFCNTDRIQILLLFCCSSDPRRHKPKDTSHSSLFISSGWSDIHTCRGTSLVDPSVPPTLLFSIHSNTWKAPRVSCGWVSGAPRPRRTVPQTTTDILGYSADTDTGMRESAALGCAVEKQKLIPVNLNKSTCKLLKPLSFTQPLRYLRDIFCLNAT